MSTTKDTSKTTPSKAAEDVAKDAPKNEDAATDTGSSSATATGPLPEETGTEGDGEEAELTAEEEAMLETQNNDAMVRAADAGIGLVDPLGRDAAYVGLAPAREGEDVKGPDGLAVVPSRSTFTPLHDVPFYNSTRVKDPASGTFYYPPAGCTSWADCNFEGSPLIPEEAPPEAVKARRDSHIKAKADAKASGAAPPVPQNALEAAAVAGAAAEKAKAAEAGAKKAEAKAEDAAKDAKK